MGSALTGQARAQSHLKKCSLAQTGQIRVQLENAEARSRIPDGAQTY